MLTQYSQKHTVAVMYDTVELKHQANIIADQLGCAVCDNAGLHDLILSLRTLSSSDNFGLELSIRAFNPPLKFCLDFNSNRSQYRKLHGGGKRQHIIRATGLHKQSGLRILDATAGLGSDSFVMACHGAQTTLVEQHPILSVMLENALQRALAITEIAEIASRMHIVCKANSIHFVQRKNVHKNFDVIYLDPMYPLSKKQAKAKKPMQVIQYLLQGSENQAEQLLQAALESGIKRVVVKRPTAAEYLNGCKPQAMIDSVNTRYDIYFCS